MPMIVAVADVFQDVNLATGGPAFRVNVGAQHPERGPDSLSARDFDARLDATVSPGPLALGIQTRRGVTAAAVTFLVGFDDQLSSFNAGVVGARGVILLFVVAPAAVIAQAVTPFCRIGRTTVRLVELVIPNQVPLRAALRLDILGKQGKT